MPNYYNITTFERQDIPQDLIDLWAATSNPKLAQYELTPPAPSPDAAWANGQWLIPPAPTWTAESWLDHEGYGAMRLLGLLDLESKFGQQSPPKMQAVRAWINSIRAQYAETKSDWQPAPHTFESTMQEIAQQEIAQWQTN
jgi:hypothetical protein